MKDLAINKERIFDSVCSHQLPDGIMLMRTARRKDTDLYGLSEEQIHLRGYILWWPSAQNEITETIKKNLGKEFDDRYIVEEDFIDNGVITDI